MEENKLNEILQRINIQRIEGLTIAADWWFDVFKRPKMDNGDRSSNGAMARMLGTTLANASPKDEAREAFREAFRAALAERQWGSGIGVDYGPDTHLSKAMDACGIAKNQAPWKTRMEPHNGLFVSVAYGYGSPYVPLYVAPVLADLVLLSPEDLEVLDRDQNPTSANALYYATSWAISWDTNNYCRDAGALERYRAALARTAAAVQPRT